MLASRGIASLALAIFDYDDLPSTIGDLDMDYFEEAIHVLLSFPEVGHVSCEFAVVVSPKDGHMSSLRIAVALSVSCPSMLCQIHVSLSFR